MAKKQKEEIRRRGDSPKFARWIRGHPFFKELLITELRVGRLSLVRRKDLIRAYLEHHKHVSLKDNIDVLLSSWPWNFTNLEVLSVVTEYDTQGDTK